MTRGASLGILPRQVTAGMPEKIRGRTVPDIKLFDEIARRAMLHNHRDEGGVGYTYYHCRRVMQLARGLAECGELRGRDIDVETMTIAAMFHDVGRDIDTKNHCEAGADFVTRELAPLLRREQLEKVALLVRRHNRPVNIESEIIHDADLIDHCGALNTWRLFHYSAAHGRNAYDTVGFFDENKEKWLFKHPEWTIFETARKEILRRLSVEEEFIRELKRELDCTL